MADQNYKNHTRYVPLFHFVTFIAIAVLLGGAIYKFLRNYDLGQGGIMIPALLILTAVIFILLAWFARAFAIKAQDRAIRAEENLRHFALTGKLMDKRLRIGQIVALRFAPDSEFISLAEKAVKDNMSSKDIKMAIQNWREDNHRV